MIESITAGQIQNENLKKDHGTYTAYDLGHAVSEDIGSQVAECIEKHINTFAKPQFCVVLQFATDPLLKTVVRRKFYAWPYLPSPNPSQSVWLFDHGDVKFLWSLPDQFTMIKVTELHVIDKEYMRMREWSNWYYEGTFWKNIRKQHGIDMLSEWEFNRRNREEGAKFIDDDTLGCETDSFYLPEIRIKKLEAAAKTRSLELDNNIVGQPDRLKRDVELKQL